MAKASFSQLLLEDKLVNEEQLQAAMQVQAQSGVHIGSILFSRKILTEEQVVKYLARVFEVPGMLVSMAIPDEKLKNLIPHEIALKHLILPIALDNKVLTIAAGNPNDLQMIQEVEFMSGCRLKIHVAMQATLKERISQFYGAGFRNEVSFSGGISLPTAGGEKMIITSVAETHVDVADDLITKDPQTALKQGPHPLPNVRPDWKEIEHRKTTVLVVDDDPNIRMLLQDGLTAKGYSVMLADRGREAVQKIQATRPDLIVLDAMLPEVHGFTICKTLKESEKYRDIPIIIISAVFTGWRFMMDVKEQYGANEVVEKPFKLTDLLAKIKLVLEESESRPDTLARKDIELTQKAEELLKTGMDAFQQGQVAAAAAAFRKGIEIDQLHPLLHYYLGKCSESNNDPFGAIAHMERSIELDPYLFPAVKDLGILFQKNGFKRKAIEMWERAVQLCHDPALKEKIKQNLMRLL